MQNESFVNMERNQLRKERARYFFCAEMRENMTFEQARAKLSEAGQEHLLRYYDELNE